MGGNFAGTVLVTMRSITCGAGHCCSVLIVSWGAGQEVADLWVADISEQPDINSNNKTWLITVPGLVYLNRLILIIALSITLKVTGSITTKNR
jgi:hypothetical protein